MDGSTPPSREILSSVMHHIDSSRRVVTNVPLDATSDDLQGYLTKLLSEIRDQPNKRVYSAVSSATEFSTCLSHFSANPILASNRYANMMADRLMREEAASIARHPNLNPVAKGSFLQFTYKDGSATRYLGVKIEHSTFIDVAALVRRSGLADDKKLYKAVSVDLGSTVAANIHVFDTNGSPAAYWWKNFLELNVQRNDAENTKNAVEAVIKVIGALKSEFPSDHNVLRNATIAAFKQSKVMRFDDFVNDLISTYVPFDPQAKPKILTVEQKLRQLPTTKNFDSLFNLDPSAVPYRQRKIVLSPEISLTVKEGIENLQDKIWASRTKDGQSILVIQTENVAGFNFKG